MAKHVAGKNREMHFLAIAKGGENYIFLFDLRSVETLIQQIAKFATDPELSFSWQEAAVLANALKKM